MNELLTSAEVATILRIKPGTLAQWRYRGYGPAYIRSGGRVLYRREAVDHWARFGHIAFKTLGKIERGDNG